MLIVGVGGYIGPVVASHLLHAGYRVTGLDAFLYDTQHAVHHLAGEPRFRLVFGDMRDEAVVGTALAGVTDVVVLAGLVGDPITKKYPRAHARVNEQGISSVFRSLGGRGLHRVVFVSTCSNYGLIPDGVLADENYELNPLSLYAKAKVAHELDLLALRDTADFEATVLRFATAFGLAPRMRFDLTVSQFTRELYLGNTLELFDAHTWRPYCHVRDFADVIQRVLEAPAEAVAFDVFNAGGDVNNFTKQMIVDAIRRHIPDADIRHSQNDSDPRNYRVDFRKIRERLDFEPRYTVEDGISELIEAMDQGLFRDVEAAGSFYGNWRLPEDLDAEPVR